MRFSVIVPLYNKEEFVERTMQSVLAQSYSDFELIVVDDGSTDNSLTVAKDCAKKNEEKCQIVSLPNGGVATARNNGVAHAKGDYVCFLDSDDWWEPDFLSEMAGLIDRYPEAGMYGTGFYLVKNGQKRIAPIGIDSNFDEGYINYCQVYAKTLCMPITSSSVAVSRQLFLETRGFRKGISLGEDFDLWIRLALKNKVALVAKPLANYFQDIPPSKRATRRLHDPQTHMLWNFDYLREEELRNRDLKILLDRLRASGLYYYFLSKEYHSATLDQIAKIDWSNVSPKWYKRYHSPIWYQRILVVSKKRMSAVKQICLKLLRKLKKA